MTTQEELQDVCNFCDTNRPIAHRSGKNTFGEYHCWCEPCWEEYRKAIEQGLAEFKAGNYESWVQVKKELGL